MSFENVEQSKIRKAVGKRVLCMDDGHGLHHQVGKFELDVNNQSLLICLAYTVQNVVAA